MSKLFQNYNRQPIEFVKAEGVYLYDTEGKKYLDFASGIGVTNLGFHPAVLESVEKQVKEIWHTPNLYLNQLQEEVAESLIGEEDYLAFFCNSGAEANEAAIKLARKFTGKSEIITFKNSFHGRTYGAMSATGQDKIQIGFEALVPDFHYADYNNLTSVKALVTDQTAAVMLELVQGEGGVLPADAGFVTELAAYCQDHDILLIVDEVQTGIGRTGRLYAYQHYGIQPDIVSLAKGLGNGLPVGAILGRTKLSPAFSYGSHGTTFGGNKLVLSSSQATLAIMNQPHFFEEVSETAQYLKAQLEEQLLPLSTVEAVRGLGFMLGIETSQPLAPIVEAAKDAGLIVITAGTNVIRLLPPIVVTKEQIDQAVQILKTSFE